jgi:DNA polymerase (family 10)
VRSLRGVGPGIERRIEELVETGELAEARSLAAELRPALVGFGRLHGLSPARTLAIARTLDLHTPAELLRAAEQGRLQDVPGIGPVTERRIRAALADPPRPHALPLSRGRELAGSIAHAVGGLVAGDVRRCCELIQDVVVVCVASSPEEIAQRLRRSRAIVDVGSCSPSRVEAVTIEGVPIAVIVAPPHLFGTELVRATGSPEFVADLETLPEAADERDVFASLGLPSRPPELRERHVAEVPDLLIERHHVRGDLHCHTRWSDGRASVLEMAEAARDLGHSYLAICDHTTSVRVVPGLDRDQLLRQGEEIERANELLAPFRVLRGVECDIRPDGELDLDDRTLAELEWVQISLHAGQRRPGSELTHIVGEAMRNPHVSCLSHPKGRILNHRPENGIDVDEIARVAAETGVALEVNGLPDRLDLSSRHLPAALRAGATVTLASDAHSTSGLQAIELALATARRGATPQARVVNGDPLERLLARRQRGASRSS